MIYIPDHIINLVPYKSGNQTGKKFSREQFSKLINLASNENPLGPSPMAVEAIKDNINEISLYPDPSGTEIVEAIAAHFNRKPSEVITGNGSDALIADVFKAFTDEGHDIITASGTFIGTFVNANKLNRNLVKVPLKEDHSYDLDEISKNIKGATKIIYIANPNNPTGKMIEKDEFDAFLEKVPEDILVLLDEAYYVYAGEHDNYPNGLDYKKDNLIVLRTLSKSYGLAGLRVGFAIGPENLIDYLYRVKLPFEPNILAQRAAIAAFKDDEFIQKTISTNKRNLEKIKQFFSENNISHTDGKANFIMVDFRSEHKANKFAEECLNNGIVVRPLPMFGLPHCVRISTGTDSQTDKAIEIFNKIIAGMKE